MCSLTYSSKLQFYFGFNVSDALVGYCKFMRGVKGNKYVSWLVCIRGENMLEYRGELVRRLEGKGSLYKA